MERVASTCGSRRSSPTCGGTRSRKSRRSCGRPSESGAPARMGSLPPADHPLDPDRKRQLPLRDRARSREEGRAAVRGHLRADAADGDPADRPGPERGSLQGRNPRPRDEGVRGRPDRARNEPQPRRVYTQIIEFSEGELRQMIGWYLDRFDVQNIKTIVRGKLFGAAPEEIQEDIVAAGSMRESFLRSLIELPSLDEVFDRLDGTIHSQALREMGLRPSEVQKWNEWEDRLTKLYYDNLLVVIPERTEGTRLMREFVRREIDIVNLRTLLRLWASKATLRYDPFVDGGLEIPKAELAEMISLDVNGLTARLRDYALTEDLAAQIKDLQALGVGSLVRSVEKLHLLEAGRYAHVHPLSVLPILDYIVRKDREVQNLRIIARGKESGLASDVIRALLVI